VAAISLSQRSSPHELFFSILGPTHQLSLCAASQIEAALTRKKDLPLSCQDDLTLGTYRGVNGTDNFHSESVSASIFRDMVRNYSNLTDMDADADIAHVDIRRIWYCYYPGDTAIFCGLSDLLN
jgi:hypothetical protein